MAYARGVNSNASSGRSWLSRLFRRQPQLPPFRPDPQPLAPFEQALDEGLLIARHGVTLAVRNRLIVRALRENKAFDDAAITAIVDEELERAAQEQRENAEGAEFLKEEASRSFGIADHAHDYHRADSVTLARRHRLYTALAESLEASRGDDAFVAGVAERARIEAWNDIGDNVLARVAKGMSSAADEPDYHLRRPERIRQLLEQDLASLLPRATDDPSDR